MTSQQAYIEGFVKRASEYGFSEASALEILKKTSSDHLGPFRADQAAEMMADEMRLKAMEYNKENHPGHYYANPFVAGPLREAITRLRRRHSAGLANDSGVASELLGGGLLNTIRGGDELRGKSREKFNKHVSEYDPE